MDEYNRIQKEYKRLIMPIKIISFSFCLMILSQDITLSIRHFYSNPFTVETRFVDARRIETPTLAICTAYQMNLTAFKSTHGKLYNKTFKYYWSNYHLFKKMVSKKLTIQQHLDIADTFDVCGSNIANCTVLAPNDTYIPCNATLPIHTTITPYRICFSFFDRKYENDANFVYNRSILANKPWVSVTFNTTRMKRKWIDVVLNGLPNARLAYHGFSGFISLSTSYFKQVQISTQLYTIEKLKKPFENDCEDYDLYDLCYSRESCIELCYANETLNQFNRWPKKLQTFKGLAEFNRTYFSKSRKTEHLRMECGEKFPKSDCLTYIFKARIIEEEMVKRYEWIDTFKLHINSYFETENQIIYKPSYNRSQLYYEISQSISSFLGFCVFDVYKLLIHLYDLFNS